MLEFFKRAGCKGVGEYIPNLPFDDPFQMNVFKQVEEIGLPLTFHVGPTIGGCYGCYDELGLPRLEKVLKACPKLILFAHSQPFWAEISADVNAQTRSGYPKGKVTPGRVVQLMRDYPNLHGDLSAGSGFNAISRDPEFGYRFMEEFQDRLLFGTDLIRRTQEVPIVPYFKKLREEKLISPEALEKISWKNANRLLKLGLPESSS
jgi:predicted TIM-barrel fold metal-dependent hydrolase